MKIYKLLILTLIMMFALTIDVKADIWGDGTTAYLNHAACEYQIDDNNTIIVNNGPVATITLNSGNDYSIADDVYIDPYLSGHYSCYTPLYLVVENNSGQYTIKGIQINSDISQFQNPDDDDEPQYTTEEEWIAAYENGWPGVMCTCTAADYYSVILSVGNSYSGYNPYAGSYIGIEDITYFGSTSATAGSFNNLYPGFQTSSGNWHCPERIYGVYDLGAVDGFSLNLDTYGADNPNLVEAPCTMTSTVNNISNVDVKKINYITRSDATDPTPNPGGEDPGDPIYEDAEIFSFCNQWRILKTFSILHTFINIARILIPILIIIFVTIDMFKVFTSGDEKAFKDSISKWIRRSIIGISVFFIPMIVKLPINMIDRSDGQFSRCNVCFNGDPDECNSIIDSLKN